jgi:hypothetical protein
MTVRPLPRKSAEPSVDAEIGHRLIEVKWGVAGLRNIRAGLMQLAYALTERPKSEAYLVLPEVAVTRERLDQEWEFAASVLRPDLLARIRLCIMDGDRFVGIPLDPDPETQRVLSRAIKEQRFLMGHGSVRGDASFVVLKVLLHHWLMDGEPMTTRQLTRTCGYSYPTVASVLNSLGSLVERRSDRRLRLRWFSRDEFARLVAMSDRARETVRFADRSGSPRTLESHVRRLETLNLPDVAIGGVLGARHYVHDLDLIGTPRLDLSQHCPKRHLDLRFVDELDPALRPVADPLEPATVVVHAVRHADPLFTQRHHGLRWVDPVECSLDLFEAHLEVQASQFIEALQRIRRVGT